MVVGTETAMEEVAATAAVVVLSNAVPTLEGVREMEATRDLEMTINVTL